MRKEGVLILTQGVLSRDIRSEPAHTHIYGGESAFVALLLARLNMNVHLLISHDEKIPPAVEREFRENFIHWSFFPHQQPIDISMSFSVASGSFGGSPLSMTTTLPLEGSVFMQESFNEEFKDQRFVIVPAHLLDSEQGREVALAAGKLIEYYHTDMVFLGGSSLGEIDNDAREVFNKLSSNLYLLALTPLDCEIFFGKQVKTAADCVFLKLLSVPYIWVDLGEKGHVLIDHGRLHKVPAASRSRRQALPGDLLREVFFAALLWRHHEHPYTDLIGRRDVLNFGHFSRSMAEEVPLSFNTPFDLPTHAQAIGLKEHPRQWWHLFWC